ncbi:hypothetical protein L6452_40788 [Arctium lappa]|uniref:Uncharacterized protein n=1 Tax=Arctium lappa TaxID=4217 RepID=A0ACB8XP18_ARCLA|nr:hypothetical protein L6452_40788 [Arctium lappa]
MEAGMAIDNASSPATRHESLYSYGLIVYPRRSWWRFVLPGEIQTVVRLVLPGELAKHAVRLVLPSA